MCLLNTEYSSYNLWREYGSMVFRLNTWSERYPGPVTFSSCHRSKDSVGLTSPGRAGKDNTVRRQFFKLILENLETIAFEPSDLVLDPIDFRIVFCALKHSRIFFNRVNPFPFSGQGKCNSVSACASEGIHENLAPSRR